MVAHIFDPFFTTKPPGKGTGLGLAVSYQILQQHQADIAVKSQPGQGARFLVALPLAPPSPAVALPPVTPDTGVRPLGYTVLLVEDDPTVRATMARSLALRGWRLLEAPDGPSALQLLEQLERLPDMVLTDISMPGGLSGLELSRHLHERYPNLRVAHTSGFPGDHPQGSHGLVSGDNYLPKPFTPSELVAFVTRNLDASL
jgi:CheY-like chemotaxis protein